MLKLICSNLERRKNIDIEPSAPPYCEKNLSI